MQKDYCILVSTCEHYSSLWKPLVKTFDLYFPDYKGNFYFSSGKSDEIFDNRFIFLKRNKKAWSDRIIDSIKRINEDFILFIVDDFFLEKQVNTTILNSIFNYLKENKDIGCIRLFDHEDYVKRAANNQTKKELVELKKKNRFRVSCQASFWRKEVLLSLLRKGEDAWTFEAYGSIRSNRSPYKYFVYNGVEKPFLYYGGFLVERGRINLEIAKQINTHTSIDFSNIFIDLDKIKLPKKPSFLRKLYRKFYWRLSIFLKHIRYF